MEKEIWKAVKGYEGTYEVSNLGNVKSLNRIFVNNGAVQKIKGKTLHLCTAKNGYIIVNLAKITSYVHRLVCTAFIGEIPFKQTVNHKDGVKANNKVNNLEIMTYSENHKHAFDVLHRKPSCMGLINTGSSKPVKRQELNGTTVEVFKSARDASRILGVSHKAISACCNGKRKYLNGYTWGFSFVWAGG